MDKNNPLYSDSVIDFVTVSVEFCKFLEQCNTQSKENFISVQLKLLPLLYLKAALLKDCLNADGYVEHPVTEEDYNFIRSSVAAIMADSDDYLDVFIDDFKYSDKPIRQTISENLADVYQPIRNFVEIYKGGFEDAMEVALSEIVESFGLSWGQKLLNALKALHDVKYGISNSLTDE